MNYTIIKPLPCPKQLAQKFPLSATAKAQIAAHRSEIEAILRGDDHRLLIITGPCSAWPSEAVLTYAKRLAQLNDKVKHALKIVMRVYIQKPRTTKGWLGPINQPNPFEAADIAKGSEHCRELMLKVINLGLPIADEALYLDNAPGFIDLLSYIAIGARSSENQAHRVFASGSSCPVGLKNPTHGSQLSAVNSVIAAQHQHVAAFDGFEVQTHGNPYAHIILRGGNNQPNYFLNCLEFVSSQLKFHSITHPAMLIDASHDNCLQEGKKNYRLQPNVINAVMDICHNHPHIKPFIKGFMLESFLSGGAQKIEELSEETANRHGLSITDPCLSWEETENTLYSLAKVYP